MGYDVSFQLIDEQLVRRELVPRMLDGRAPPPSAFDALPDASPRWERARAEVLGAEPERAARAACEIVLAWSACSLPHVETRNLAITYHPLRMEEELQGIPDAGFGSAERLFEALLAKRPELRGHFPERLEDDASAGGLCADPFSAGRELRRFRLRLPPHLRDRVSPILSAVRAADRHELLVWETSLPLERAAPEMLHWPGLDRWGAGDHPLSAEEWTRLADADVTQYGDVIDIMDVVVTVVPTADTATTHAILRLLRQIDPGHLSDDSAPLLAWLRPLLGHPELHLEAWLADRLVEKGLYDWGDGDVTGFTPAPSDAYAALARSLADARPTITTPAAISLLMHRAEREIADLAPIAAEVLPRIIRVLADAPEGRWRERWIRVCFKLRDTACPDGAVPPALRPLLARAWKTMRGLDPEAAGNFADRLGGAAGECFDLLFEGAPEPSVEGLEAVHALLFALERAPAEERTAIVDAHRAGLAALVEFGLARGARVDDVIEALDTDPSFLPIFEDAMQRRDFGAAGALSLRVPSSHVRACLDRLFAGATEPSEELLDALIQCADALVPEDGEPFGREHRPRLLQLIELGEKKGRSVRGIRSLLARVEE